MRIAYFSPFSPDRSGVSDFAEELLPELAKYMEIDLFSRSEISNSGINEMFQVYRVEDYPIIREQINYDFTLYQVGNNLFHKPVIDTFMQYPDVLEIHDLSLHHYLAMTTIEQGNDDKYVEIMRYCHGREGEHVARNYLSGMIREPWGDQSAKFTVNKYLIDKAKAAIVHSDYAKQSVKVLNPGIPVINIPLHTPDIISDYDQYKTESKEKLGIPQDMLVLGSFGYATIDKRIEPILEALAQFKMQYESQFQYYIVGHVEGIDIDAITKKLGLQEQVFVTGFVKIEDFKRYMSACDICFNLRYPTQGESSASLHRMLGMGKPIMVTNVGSFEEYPEEIVAKIRYGENEIYDIVNTLNRMTGSKEELKRRSKLAFEFAYNNCCLEKNAKRYYCFLKSVKNNNYQDEYIDHLLDEMMKLNLNDENYVGDLCEKLNWY